MYEETRTEVLEICPKAENYTDFKLKKAISDIFTNFLKRKRKQAREDCKWKQGDPLPYRAGTFYQKGGITCNICEMLGICNALFVGFRLTLLCMCSIKGVQKERDTIRSKESQASAYAGAKKNFEDASMVDDPDRDENHNQAAPGGLCQDEDTGLGDHAALSDELFARDVGQEGLKDCPSKTPPSNTLMQASPDHEAIGK